MAVAIVEAAPPGKGSAAKRLLHPALLPASGRTSIRITARSIAWETSNCSVAVRFESLILVVPQPTSTDNSSARQAA